MARIAVIGMNSFGYHVARSLSEQGSEVLAIDISEQAVDNIKAYVARAVVADATDRRVLRELGLGEMDSVVLSLGSKLDASVLTAMHLRELGVKNIVAKALSDDHVKILEIIGVHRVVFPERDMGQRIAASLQGVYIVDYLPLGAELSIVEMNPLKEMVGKSLLDLDFRSRYNCQVLALRDKSSQEDYIIPGPDTMIRPYHVLVVMGKNDSIAKISKLGRPA